MMRSRFGEERITAVLRKQEAGVSTTGFCRKQAISCAMFDAWKPRFGRMDVSESGV